MPKYKIVAGTTPHSDEQGNPIVVPVYGTIFDGKKHHACGDVIELTEADAAELVKQGTVVPFDPDADEKARRKAEADAKAAAEEASKAAVAAMREAGRK